MVNTEIIKGTDDFGMYKLAEIQDVRFTVEESHGWFTFGVSLLYENGDYQVYGGTKLERMKTDEIHTTYGDHIGTMYGCEFFKQLLLEFDVTRFEDLKGKLCKAYIDHNDKVEGIRATNFKRKTNGVFIRDIIHQYNNK